MNNILLKILLFIFSHLLLTNSLLAQDPPPIVINDTTTHYLLASNFSLLKDEEKRLTIQDVISPAIKQAFVYKKEQKFNFGRINATYWFKFQIKNVTNTKIDLFLKINYHGIDKIDLYIVEKNNTLIVKRSGDQIPFDQREIHHRIPLFRLTLNAHQQQKYYLKVEENGGTLNMPISFWTPEAHAQEDYKEQYILGIYYGVLVIVLLFNLFLFRTLGDRTYLNYVLYIFCMMIGQLSLDGFGFQYFWPNFFWLSNHIVPLSVCLGYCFFIKFAQSFLNTKYYHPKIDKVMSTIWVLVIFILLISLFNNPFYAFSLKLTDILVFVIGIVIIIAAISSLKTNFRVNVYFLSAFLTLIIFYCAYILKVKGILPGFFLTDYGIHLGSSLEAIVLSFALAVRFKIMKEDKEKAQQEVLQQLTRMNKLKGEMNIQLEHRVKERTKEITDSIYYAGYIQGAILPRKQEVTKALPEHFILYKPKDIVSGDFYWISERNSNVSLIAADCTGHGVPGAFMSMLCISLLNELVNEKGFIKPCEILDQVRAGIIRNLKQKGEAGEQKDGMDACLCVWNKNANTLEYAGAYNSLYLIRQFVGDVHVDPEFLGRNPDSIGARPLQIGETEIVEPSICNDSAELFEIKADRQPVGISDKKEKPFTNHHIKLFKDDTIFIFSDGFADQFGGKEDIKFSRKRFRQLLLNIQHLSMQKQRQRLDKVIKEWIGDKVQLDDILVIGVRF